MRRPTRLAPRPQIDSFDLDCAASIYFNSMATNGVRRVRIALAMMVGAPGPQDDLRRAIRSALDVGGPHGHLIDDVVIVYTGEDAATWAGIVATPVYAERRSFTDEHGFNFGAARSYTLELAERRGADYCLILDADEYLDESTTEAWSRIRGSLEGRGRYQWKGSGSLTRRAVDSVRVSVKNRMERGKAWAVDHSERILPASWRYSGSVHHQLVVPEMADQAAVRRTPRVLPTKAAIIHLGYDLSGDESRTKYERRLPMLLEEAAHCSPDLKSYYRYKLGEGLFGCGRWREAFVAFRESLVSEADEKRRVLYGPYDHGGALVRMVRSLIRLYDERGQMVGEPNQALQLVRRTVELSPTEPLVAYHGGVLLRLYGLPDDALSFFYVAKTLAEAHGDAATMRFDTGVIDAMIREMETGEVRTYKALEVMT